MTREICIVCGRKDNVEEGTFCTKCHSWVCIECLKYDNEVGNYCRKLCYRENKGYGSDYETEESEDEKDDDKKKNTKNND